MRGYRLVTGEAQVLISLENRVLFAALAREVECTECYTNAQRGSATKRTGKRAIAFFTRRLEICTACNTETLSYLRSMCMPFRR